MACPSERTLHEQLFDRQVETLLLRGYHEALGMAEKDFRLWLDLLLIDRLEGRLLDGVGETDLNSLPLLIVIPHAMLPIAEQMKLLIVAKKRGYVSLDSEKLWNPDGIGESKFPYLICGVEDGAGNVGKVTADAAGEISRACRSGLVFEEGISLAVHFPESLIHHAFALIGNHYQGGSPCGSRGSNSSPQCVPELWLGSGGPTQNYSWLNSRRDDRGVPSCARRLTLDREPIL